MSSQFSNLAIEVVLAIIEQLVDSPAALAALAQVDSAFHSLVIPYLYRRMTKYQGRAHRKFLRTIERNPSRASFVRIYHTPTRSARHVYLWRMIHSGLYKMHNLEELVFRAQSRFCLRPGYRVLPEVGPGMPPPFQLKRFVWAVRNWEMEHAVNFSYSQTSLDYIYWATTTTGPISLLGALRGRLREYLDRRKANGDLPYLPDAMELRWDCWKIAGSSEDGPTYNNDQEARTRGEINRTPGMKEFRTMQAIRHGGGRGPFITFQYTRQMSLNDKPVFGGNQNWFLKPRPGARHPLTDF